MKSDATILRDHDDSWPAEEWHLMMRNKSKQMNNNNDNKQTKVPPFSRSQHKGWCSGPQNRPCDLRAVWRLSFVLCSLQRTHQKKTGPRSCLRPNNGGPVSSGQARDGFPPPQEPLDPQSPIPAQPISFYGTRSSYCGLLCGDWICLCLCSV